MPAVDAHQVVTFLGRAGETTLLPLAEAHLPVVTEMARAYTRGKGFGTDGTPGTALAAVIISATARSMNNPTADTLQMAGPFQVRPGVFNGWTLAELSVLHTYRRRAR